MNRLLVAGLLSLCASGCAPGVCREEWAGDEWGRFKPIERCIRQECRDLTNGRLVRCP